MMQYGYSYVGMAGVGWFWMLLVAALVVIPFWRLLPRHGMPAPLALLAIFPPIALILLWVLAFSPVSADAGRGGMGEG